MRNILEQLVSEAVPGDQVSLILTNDPIPGEENLASYEGIKRVFTGVFRIFQEEPDSKKEYWMCFDSIDICHYMSLFVKEGFVGQGGSRDKKSRLHPVAYVINENAERLVKIVEGSQIEEKYRKMHCP